ncbi:MAG: ADP-ribosylglycohydrolase family protein, partial [Aquificaceae bacterium]
MTELKSKFRGAILGEAIGDAIGKCVEDVTKEEVYKFYRGRVESFVEPHPLSPAYGCSSQEVSDETRVTILLVESIVEMKSIDTENYYNKLLLWRRDEKSHRYPDPSLLLAIDRG